MRNPLRAGSAVAPIVFHGQVRGLKPQRIQELVAALHLLETTLRQDSAGEQHWAMCSGAVSDPDSAAASTAVARQWGSLPRSRKGIEKLDE